MQQKTSVLFLLPCLLLSLSASAQTSTFTARVQVQPDKTIRIVDSKMFGLNTAVWDSHMTTPFTVRSLRRAGVKFFRFPGGSLSDVYHWQTNQSEGSNYKWAVDFDQFMGMVRAVGAKALVTVNYGTGTPQEAAAWVRYANKVRHYHVEYWEVGNECYGGWEKDNHSSPHDAYTYAVNAAAYIHAMKAADPSIHVGVVVITGQNAYANSKDKPVLNTHTGHMHNGWTPVVLSTLRKLHVLPDFVIYHRYEQGPGRENDAALLQKAKTWPDDAEELLKQLRDYYGKQSGQIALFCTENNSVYSNTGKQTTSIVNALYLADSLGSILDTPFQAWVWWDLRNGEDAKNNNSPALYGWRNYGDYGIMGQGKTRYPTYYAYRMFRHFVRAGDAMAPAQSSSDLLTAYAARHKSGSLALLLINKSPDENCMVEIEAGAFRIPEKAELFQYGTAQDNAAKTGGNGQGIARQQLTLSSARTVTLPPYSLTVVRFAKRQAP